MVHSKKLVFIAIIGIVVAGSSNSALILQAWSQRPAPPTDQKNADYGKQGGPARKDARLAPLPKPDETPKVEIFAIEYEPIEGVTGPKPLEPPASNQKFAFGGYPFYDDVNLYPHQKPLFVVNKEDVQYCKLKSRVHNIVDRTRRIVLEVGFTREAQAELSQHCFHRASEALQEWTARARSVRPTRQLPWLYRAFWRKQDRQAGVVDGEF